MQGQQKTEQMPLRHILDVRLAVGGGKGCGDGDGGDGDRVGAASLDVTGGWPMLGCGGGVG